jgi:hypothetical protein
MLGFLASGPTGGIWTQKNRKKKYPWFQGFFHVWDVTELAIIHIVYSLAKPNLAINRI